jgi:hypothetical protein
MVLSKSIIKKRTPRLESICGVISVKDVRMMFGSKEKDITSPVVS